MIAAFVLFDRLTVMDFVGAYDPITRLKSMDFHPEFEWELCAMSESVQDDRGLELRPDRVGPSLASYDLVVIPGGLGTRPLQRDPEFIEWLQTAAPVSLKVSVCTGSLLLGAAGFLTNRRATTHPNAMGDLKRYAAEVVNERVVDEGPVVTGRGVTSGIDVGLHVVHRLAGEEVRTAVAEQMDYPYDRRFP